MKQTILNFRTDKETVYEQSVDLFEQLAPHFHNTVRTWIKVKDIDNNYKDFVQGRIDVFKKYGYTKDTHFLASTCVGAVKQRKWVTLKALVVPDLASLNPVYMEATDYLPHTHTYGVTFERGIKLHLPDKHLYFISGTASIRADGSIAHKGDLLAQLNRALFNTDMLLKKYDATLENMHECTIYVRNKEDIPEVQKFVITHPNFDTKGLRFEHAPICRPEWLVEVETIAVKEINNVRTRPSYLQ